MSKNKSLQEAIELVKVNAIMENIHAFYLKHGDQSLQNKIESLSEEEVALLQKYSDYLSEAPKWEFGAFGDALKGAAGWVGSLFSKSKPKGPDIPQVNPIPRTEWDPTYKPADPVPQGPPSRLDEPPKDYIDNSTPVTPKTELPKAAVEPPKLEAPKTPEAPKNNALRNTVIGGGAAVGTGVAIDQGMKNTGGDPSQNADAGVPPQDQMGNPSPGTETDASGTPFNPKKEEPPKAAEPPKAPNYDEMSFGDAFKAARAAAKGKGAESTGQFTWRGNQYQTNIKGEKYVAPSKQTKVNESLLAAFNQVVSSKHPNLFAEAAKKNLDEAGGIYPQGGYDTGRSRTWGPVNPMAGIGAGDNTGAILKNGMTPLEIKDPAIQTAAFKATAVDGVRPGEGTTLSQNKNTPNQLERQADIARMSPAVSGDETKQKEVQDNVTQTSELKPAETPKADYSTTVKSGDNLWNLVKARGKSGMTNQEIASEVDRVAKLNKMADPNKLSIGQNIKFNEGTEPKTEKEKKLAALAEPKDKITHKDVLVGRGVVKEASIFSEAELAHMEAVAPTPKKYAPAGSDKSNATGSKSGTLSDETDQQYAFELLKKAKPVPMPVYQPSTNTRLKPVPMPVYQPSTNNPRLKPVPMPTYPPLSEAKVGRKSEEESLGDNMLHMNAKRAADNMSGIKHKFANGETVNMTKGMAVAFMNRHAAAKTADQKDAVLKHANKSFDSFKSVVAGDKIPEPEKNTIKLGSMKSK